MTFTAFTSLLLVVECQAFALLLVMRRGEAAAWEAPGPVAEEGPSWRLLEAQSSATAERRRWIGFFLLLAISHAFGFSKHSWDTSQEVLTVMPDPRAVGLVVVSGFSSLASIVAITLAQLSLLARYPTWAELPLLAFVLAQAVAVFIWLLADPAAFGPVVVHAGLALFPLMVVEALNLRGPRGRPLLLAGLGGITLAGAAYSLTAVLGPSLSRTEVSHFIMAAALALIYAGVARSQAREAVRTES